MKKAVIFVMMMTMPSWAFAVRATYAFQSGAHADFNSNEGRISVVGVHSAAQKYDKDSIDELYEKDRFELNLQANAVEQNEFAAFIKTYFPDAK